jgi:hypothetical protein
MRSRTHREELTTEVEALELVNSAMNRWLIAYAERAAFLPIRNPTRRRSPRSPLLRARGPPHQTGPGRQRLPFLTRRGTLAGSTGRSTRA